MQYTYFSLLSYNIFIYRFRHEIDCGTCQDCLFASKTTHKLQKKAKFFWVARYFKQLHVSLSTIEQQYNLVLDFFAFITYDILWYWERTFRARSWIYDYMEHLQVRGVLFPFHQKGFDVDHQVRSEAKIYWWVCTPSPSYRPPPGQLCLENAWLGRPLQHAPNWPLSLH